jgi:hypothetical protein
MHTDRKERKQMENNDGVAVLVNQTDDDDGVVLVNPHDDDEDGGGGETVAVTDVQMKPTKDDDTVSSSVPVKSDAGGGGDQPIAVAVPLQRAESTEPTVDAVPVHSDHNGLSGWSDPLPLAPITPNSLEPLLTTPSTAVAGAAPFSASHDDNDHHHEPSVLNTLAGLGSLSQSSATATSVVPVSPLPFPSLLPETAITVNHNWYTNKFVEHAPAIAAALKNSSSPVKDVAAITTEEQFTKAMIAIRNVGLNGQCLYAPICTYKLSEDKTPMAYHLLIQKSEPLFLPIVFPSSYTDEMHRTETANRATKESFVDRVCGALCESGFFKGATSKTLFVPARSIQPIPRGDTKPDCRFALKLGILLFMTTSTGDYKAIFHEVGIVTANPNHHVTTVSNSAELSRARETGLISPIDGRHVATSNRVQVELLINGRLYRDYRCLISDCDLFKDCKENPSAYVVNRGEIYPTEDSAATEYSEWFNRHYAPYPHKLETLFFVKPPPVQTKPKKTPEDEDEDGIDIVTPVVSNGKAPKLSAPKRKGPQVTATVASMTPKKNSRQKPDDEDSDGDFEMKVVTKKPTNKKKRTQKSNDVEPSKNNKSKSPRGETVVQRKAREHVENNRDSKILEFPPGLSEFFTTGNLQFKCTPIRKPKEGEPLEEDQQKPRIALKVNQWEYAKEQQLFVYDPDEKVWLLKLVSRPNPTSRSWIQPKPVSDPTDLRGKRQPGKKTNNNKPPLNKKKKSSVNDDDEDVEPVSDNNDDDDEEEDVIDEDEEHKKSSTPPTTPAAAAATHSINKRKNVSLNSSPTKRQKPNIKQQQKNPKESHASDDSDAE